MSPRVFTVAAVLVWIAVLAVDGKVSRVKVKSAKQRGVNKTAVSSLSTKKVKSAKKRKRSSAPIDDVKKDLKEIRMAMKGLQQDVSAGVDKLIVAIKAAEKTKPAPGPSPRPPPKGSQPMPGPPGKIPIGHNIGLHNAKYNRFVRMNHGRIDASAEKNVDAMPPNWQWEKFYTKDVGGGKVALYCAGHGRWMSTHHTDMKVSNPGDARRNPGGWEHLTVVGVKGGKIRLKTHRNTWVEMKGSDCSHSANPSMEDSTFTVVDLGKTGPPPPPRRG